MTAPHNPPLNAVEQAIENVNGRFRHWNPTPGMMGYARAVAREAVRIAAKASE